MQRFNSEVGAVITIVTRYKDDYIFSDKSWKYNSYENVTVLEPEKWMKPNQVKISSDTARMPFRVIEIRSIYTVNGKEIAQPKFIKTERVKVTGSKGDQYTVMIEDGTATSCTCPGFAFRNKCRHLAEVTA